jgi:hypothetical protein
MSRSRYFDYAVECIKNAMDEDVNVNVVVHCMCGVSRSPTIDIAYLMAIQDMSLSDSLSHVRAKREISYPNRGFMNQLADYGFLIHTSILLNRTLISERKSKHMTHRGISPAAFFNNYRRSRLNNQINTDACTMYGTYVLVFTVQ